MRKNIFQILESTADFHREIARINALFQVPHFSTASYLAGRFTAEQLVDEYLLKNWKQRRRCISTHDMRELLYIDLIIDDSQPSLSATIVFLEYVLNIVSLCTKSIEENNAVGSDHELRLIIENITSFLDTLNHEFVCFEQEELVLVVEKKPSASAVADIVKPELSLNVFRYNHHLLKGDIASKKMIILSFANELEHQRKVLESLDKSVASNLFYLLNNMNLRHNNVEKGKNHKKYVSEMTDLDIEKWYDEVYQLELLAFLLLENNKRNELISELKSKMEDTPNDQ